MLTKLYSNESNLQSTPQISLSNMNVTSIASCTFIGLKKITTLTLTNFSSMSSLTDNMLSGLTSLITLSLSSNALKSIDDGVALFNGANNLQTLILTSNQVCIITELFVSLLLCSTSFYPVLSGFFRLTLLELKQANLPTKFNE